MKTKIINYIIGLICFIYYYFSIITSYFLIVKSKGGWCFGDWIINYQDGGFKRRGLFGTLFIWINELTHLNLEYIVFAFIFLVYTIFFSLLVKFFWKEKNNLLVVALILLPAGFGMIVKDPNIAARKEILFFLFYLIYLLCLRSRIIIKDLTITIVIIALLLTHESAFFYIPFVGFTYFIKNDGPALDKIKKIFLYQLIPAVTIMLLLHKFGIDIRTENTESFFKAHGLLLNELGIFDYDPNFNVMNIYKVHSYSYQTYGISILLGALTVYIYCKLNNVKINAVFLTVQIIFLIPLFYLAVDWGRWVNIFFSLLTLFIAAQPRAILNQKKEIIAVILILFNFTWKMIHKTQGFLTFPEIDSFIKRLYYFIYYKFIR